jgi:hypothetical protein
MIPSVNLARKECIQTQDLGSAYSALRAQFMIHTIVCAKRALLELTSQLLRGKLASHAMPALTQPPAQPHVLLAQQARFQVQELDNALLAQLALSTLIKGQLHPQHAKRAQQASLLPVAHPHALLAQQEHFQPQEPDNALLALPEHTTLIKVQLHPQFARLAQLALIHQRAQPHARVAARELFQQAVLAHAALALRAPLNLQEPLALLAQLVPIHPVALQRAHLAPQELTHHRMGQLPA